ncbi:alpha/beta fold hydrolase [Flavivirga abyssicola]|uniref:alpha/beta hydrolase family protein n=1 Tax=Flavivirga abyssicola TaxID=3063533 RepID=UPI0026E09EBC|nr:alpha/beta fold hydrolase [Flavivirga sp. MEBiC07777]WVK12575.1 alpha/beta fold hydrolase [Flavivirga sp. MEBiC07777]
MKKSLLIITIALLTVLSTYSQNIEGKWNGILDINEVQLRVIFNISKNDKGYTATMDSPDQGAKGIPVSHISFNNSKLIIKISNVGINYQGEFNSEKFKGVFKQNGYEIPLTLSKKTAKKKSVKRPQNPIEPYPYYTEEVTFTNPTANISLCGTLSLPKKEGVFPVAILISGSGPQNRDEEIMRHKPFLVIADYLTRNGIAVLRYDDRGVGKSEGVFPKATSADFATDVESAVAYLKARKEINKNKIGLIGHSEGGMIAPMVASKSKDVSFIVLLAGTGMSGKDILLLQQQVIFKAGGMPQSKISKITQSNSEAYELIINSKNDNELKTNLSTIIEKSFKQTNRYIKANEEDKKELLRAHKKNSLAQFLSPWMKYFLKYNPIDDLENVKCPVLALNGGKDLQVPPIENIEAIKQALLKGGNKQVITKIYPELNHLFQECQTGLIKEYAKIEQTFSPVVLKDIKEWIINQPK